MKMRSAFWGFVQPILRKQTSMVWLGLNQLHLALPQQTQWPSLCSATTFI